MIENMTIDENLIDGGDDSLIILMSIIYRRIFTRRRCLQTKEKERKTKRIRIIL